MREFFRGWRRKIGMMTLVMACVFMAGWVRSLNFLEGVKIPISEKRTDSLKSYRSSFVWTSEQYKLNSSLSSEFISINDSGVRPIWGNPLVVWSWQLLGFGFGKSVNGTTQVANRSVQIVPSIIAVVPYWSIVLPLTLLSAYLLLNKPRVAKPK